VGVGVFFVIFGLVIIISRGREFVWSGEYVVCEKL